MYDTIRANMLPNYFMLDEEIIGRTARSSIGVIMILLEHVLISLPNSDFVVIQFKLLKIYQDIRPHGPITVRS